MIKTVNECVGCPQGCANCGRKRVNRTYCDKCGEEIDGDIYEHGLIYEDLCESCLLELCRKRGDLR